MSNSNTPMENNTEEPDDDVYDEESSCPTATNAAVKEDIHAWRKRNSYAFQRKPLLVRRMSRGEPNQKQINVHTPIVPLTIDVSSHRSLFVLCNMILCYAIIC